MTHRSFLPAGFLGLWMIFGLFSFTGCAGPEDIPKPKDLISEQNYIDLLVEMQHITTWKNARPDSVNADSMKQLIYKKYHITEKQFFASHEYYQKDLSHQLDRVDEAIHQLQSEETYIEQHIDSVKKNEEQDSLLHQDPSSD